MDGTFLQRAELKGTWDFIVFVDVAKELALSRGISRDSILLGGEAKAYEVYERRYLPAFEIYDARVSPREHGDIVIKNDNVERPELG